MAAIQVGILYDYPPADGGEAFERALRLGFDQGDSPPVELTARTTGLRNPEAVVAAYRDLVSAGAVVVLGPAVSDSALALVPLLDEFRVPCINYSGSEKTRADFGFHYQVGSLEEEPFVLAGHLAARSLIEVAVVHDRSFIGEQYDAFFAEACQRHKLRITHNVSLDPDGSDAETAAARVADSKSVAYLGLGMSAYPLGRRLPAGLPVVATSALIFGHALPDRTTAWEGWTYVDASHDDNPVLSELKRNWNGDFPSGPVVPCAHDMGRLLGEALRRAPELTGDGVRIGLEQVKHLPAALGAPGTTMGFGRWERSALKGDYLVIRRWLGGKSVQWRPAS